MRTVDFYFRETRAKSDRKRIFGSLKKMRPEWWAETTWNIRLEIKTIFMFSAMQHIVFFFLKFAFNFSRSCWGYFLRVERPCFYCVSRHRWNRILECRRILRHTSKKRKKRRRNNSAGWHYCIEKHCRARNKKKNFSCDL